MNNGWIKLHRKLLEWEWWDDHNTTRLFLYILLKANHTDKKWKGETIKRGQLLTGRIKLSEGTGLSQQQVRTSLKRLKSTSELTIKTTNQFSLITVVNWDKYQITDDKSTSESTSNLTNEQPTDNQRITTTKNEKNEKNVKINKYSLSFIKKNKQQIINEAEEKYKNRNVKKAIEDFIEYCEINKTSYKNFKLAFFKWVREDRFNKYRKELSVKDQLAPFRDVPDKFERSGEVKSANDILDINRFKNE